MIPRPARAALAAWLRAPGSLSARLACACPPFAVRCVRQGRAPAWPGEAAALGLAPGTALVAREVLLCGGGAAQVFARSVTSARAARGAWRALQGLGNRPLAELLYDRADIHRSALQWQWLAPADPRTRAIARAWRAAGPAWPARGVWMRHSVFRRHGQALRVAEVFLPARVARWPRVPACTRPAPAGAGR